MTREGTLICIIVVSVILALLWALFNAMFVLKIDISEKSVFLESDQEKQNLMLS